MKIHLLGTTGYHPSPQRHTACMMIPRHGIILDAGTGMFRARDLIETSQLDIFLSHAHLDHCLGLTFLFDVLHEKNVDSVRVFAEAEKIEAMQTHLFSPLLFPVIPPFEFVEISSECDFGDYRLTTFPLEHPGGSIGMRFDFQDASMAYVTDTTATEDADYIKHLRDVDLLIHECYFADGLEDRAELTGHSCLTPVCELALKAGAKQLVLVHVNPLDDGESLDLEAGRQIFDRVVIGRDQTVLEL